MITSVGITDEKGNPLDHSLDKWENFRINAQFSLPNKTVKVGDTTTIALPDKLRFNQSEEFDIKDKDGHTVAKAVLDSETKKVTLTYTGYVETHSDITGSFFFNVLVDHEVVTQEETIPVTIEVEGKVINAGNVGFTGVGETEKTDMTKSGWIDNKTGIIHYQIPVNRSGKNLPASGITDTLKSQGITYIKDSFKIEKGNWVTQGSEWEFQNGADVTNQFTINFQGDTGFEINLGDISETDAYFITYDAKADYKLNDGEILYNTATLTSNGQKITDITYEETYRESGGTAEGYVYTIKLHKHDEDGKPLAGAIFTVTRDANGQAIGEFTTDAEGNITITDLLKDSYTIKEKAAPDGYQLSGESIKILENDFGSDKSVAKDIVNKKIPESTTTTETTTQESTTTTEAPTTTAAETTTEEVTSTTEGPTTTSDVSETTTQGESTTEGATTTTEAPTTEAPTTTEGATIEGETTTEVSTIEAPTTTKEPITTEVPATTSRAMTTTETVTTQVPAAMTSSAGTASQDSSGKISDKRKAASNGLPSTGSERGFALSLLGLVSISAAGIVYYRKHLS